MLSNYPLARFAASDDVQKGANVRLAALGEPTGGADRLDDHAATFCWSASMTDAREAEISWFHRSGRESGVSWWGERPTWARHLTYWVVALGLLSLSLFDTDAGPATSSNDDLSSFVWIVMGILSIGVAALIFTLREWNAVGLPRTVSRSLVLFTFILGFAASWLFFARGFGVEINGCRALGRTRDLSRAGLPPAGSRDAGLAGSRRRTGAEDH